MLCPFQDLVGQCTGCKLAFSGLLRGVAVNQRLLWCLQDEPAVLPARVPHLLVNGAAGIAVGIATKIPPHNLREVVAGLKALIRDPDISISQLMQHIPGPDFPTGWAPQTPLTRT